LWFQVFGIHNSRRTSFSTVAARAAERRRLDRVIPASAGYRERSRCHRNRGRDRNRGQLQRRQAFTTPRPYTRRGRSGPPKIGIAPQAAPRADCYKPFRC
jgi:hypothetical protein